MASDRPQVNIKLPRDAGGIIKQPGITGHSFLSRCPIPDIQANTKILAVCGINDYNVSHHPDKPGLAAPSQDGWFFSDFYFLHHILKDISRDQIWLTCVRPKEAVRKYTQYVQGNWRIPGDRRVVLDQSILPEVEDVRCVPPQELITTFLATLRKVCAEASESPRPILVIVCTHGDARTYSWQMGGTGPAVTCPRVTMNKFKEALGTRRFAKPLCLLTTSCYGGGWAINPELNITSMFAQNRWEQSLAWPVSGTANSRFCGSPFASAIAKTLLNLTIEGMRDDELDNLYEVPTYAGFITLVTQKIKELDPRGIGQQGTPDYASVHNPTFSAQDDTWEMAYSKRTGLPLDLFKQRWVQLRAAGYSSPPPGGEHRFGPGERILSYDALKTITEKEAREYMKSYPGLDSAGGNTSLHGPIHLLLSGNQKPDPDPEELGYLRQQIDYRMNHIMASATLYKNYLGVKMKDCHEVDTWDYPRRNSEDWRNAIDFVGKYRLFDEPIGLQGQAYPKGEEYMVTCILEAGWGKKQAEVKLDELMKYKENTIPRSGVSAMDGTSRIMYTINSLQLHRNPSIREKIREIAQRTTKRMRSLSPSKRRQPLPTSWTHDGGAGGMTTGMGIVGTCGPSRS